jgi:hypothetical protein
MDDELLINFLTIVEGMSSREQRAMVRRFLVHIAEKSPLADIVALRGEAAKRLPASKDRSMILSVFDARIAAHGKQTPKRSRRTVRD